MPTEFICWQEVKVLCKAVSYSSWSVGPDVCSWLQQYLCRRMFFTDIRICTHTEMLQQMSWPILQQRHRSHVLQVSCCMYHLYFANSLQFLFIELLFTKRWMCGSMYRNLLRQHDLNEMYHINIMQAILWCKLDKYVYKHMPNWIMEKHKLVSMRCLSCGMCGLHFFDCM